MKLLNNKIFYFTVLLVILSISVPETDARRLVLRGRRTITRHYNRGLAIPAWAIIVIVALCQLVIGVVLYFVMRKFVLSGTSNTNSYTPAMMDDV
ncbi:hypothetical protein HA402_000367 [Bradysia odoriphaga]|uniref:uncharacterized protein LOC119075004 n=1 Tax=Bradysia coprophila TaxID=38358 RepID=UPI00187D990E|nr:uncharacterized protein LOC119075004 [Bradysia coprophila]KAG4074388.1 hypothetical protein HA402_000367 [Bradysia odoriphaga]